MLREQGTFDMAGPSADRVMPELDRFFVHAEGEQGANVMQVGERGVWGSDRVRCFVPLRSLAG